MYRSYTDSQSDFHPILDVQTQLRNLSQDFATSFNTGNYDHAATLFAGDGVFMAPQYEGAYGQKLVERLLRQMGETGYSNLRVETTRVDHSGDMAMEIGRFTISLHKSDGKLVTERGKYVKVWKRMGSWLIMADCWSRTSLAASDRAA
jgi:ketosteroid isomerase-like protein